MSLLRRFTGWKYRDAALLALVTMFVVLIAYHLGRFHKVDVGSLGDAPFLSGFHADEADIGYRYRWTTGHAEVSFPGIGSAPAKYIFVHAQGARPDGASVPVTMTVSLNGILLQPQGGGSQPIILSKELRLYGFQAANVTRTYDSLDDVTIDTSTFRAPGDSRALGVKVDYVQLVQDEGGVNVPPVWIPIWSFVLVLGLYLLLSLVPPRMSRISNILGFLLFLFLLLFFPMYYVLYLPPVAATVGLLGLLVWQRDRVRRWPEAVEALRIGPVASYVMGTALLIYAVVALWVLPQVDWIGHADYAENAVIARNLVNGRGLTVDYMAQFYTNYGPGISHPADTWPLLQPVLIAPFFVVMGTATWVAKLPNLVLLLALAWAVFGLAWRLWDGRIGLFAGLLTLVHPYFFNSVLYPINDLAFTLIFFLLAWAVWSRVGPLMRDGRFPTFTALAAFFRTRDCILIGGLSGLLLWSKPSGAALIVGLLAWAAWAWWRFKPGWRTLPWRALLLAAGVALLVLLPLLVRNIGDFSKPFYSTEGYDAWILRYWPLHDWEDIYKVYIGKELPHPRWIVGGKFGYQNLVDAIVLNFKWVWEKGVLNPNSGDFVLGLLPLAGALVGLAAASRRAAALFGMVGFGIGLYALSVLLYWHFEGRYFQLVVPWVYMLLACGVFWTWDRLREKLSDLADARVDANGFFGGLLGRSEGMPLLIAVMGFLLPSLSSINNQILADTTPTGFVTGMQWLKQNSTPQDVVMTRDPWELNWYTERKAVMIPNEDLTTIESTARKYGATMLQLGGPVDGISVRDCPDATGIRPALGKLYCGEERPGYKLLYRQGGLTIYRLTGK